MMSSPYSQRLRDPPDISTIHHSPTGVVVEWLQQPTVIISAALLIFTAIYQSLHSSPFSQPRHPGELLWGFIVTVTPALFLYALDNWLNPPIIPLPESMRPPRPRTYAAKSELLRKILGMDNPGGIISSVASAGRRSLSTLSIKRNSQQPPGLGNVDYSCFQNSILQSLSSLKPLPSYLDSAVGEPLQDQTRASELQRLIAELSDTSNNGKTLWTPARLKSLHTWEQQDAQEYYSKLLDEIEKEAAKLAKAQHKPPGLESAVARDDTEDSQHSEDSGYQSLSVLSKPSSEPRIPKNPLEGMMAQRVACVQCGFFDGLSMIPFNCITLNLGVGRQEHDLFELLDSYTQLEPIQGVECAKCTLLKAQRLLKLLVNSGEEKGLAAEQLKEPQRRLQAVELALEEDDFADKTLTEGCKISPQHRVSSTKTKQVVIARPPRSLAIHMNRSVFDETTGHMWKNLSAVKFPRMLDLGPWCLGSADESFTARDRTLAENEKSLEKLVSDEEQWISNPRVSMISGDIYPSKISGPIYELRAVVTHQGQHENGHYVCYRKHAGVPAQVEDAENTGGEESKPSDEEKTLVDTEVDENTDQWWRLSDESVWEVSEETILGQGGVFMLFYDCVDPHSVLTSELEKADKTHNAGDVTQQPLTERGADAVEAEPSAVRELSDVLNDDEGMPELSKVSTQSTEDLDNAVPTEELDVKVHVEEQGATGAEGTCFIHSLDDGLDGHVLHFEGLSSTLPALVQKTALRPDDGSDGFVFSLLTRPNS
ncbi:hypothetical protein BX600DRAFT_463804 [Xylariales sp. PMI_506]|nr:hypothetical protein BX600DRAFT_463804 [Xylariales sp. PMI_506]